MRYTPNRINSFDQTNLGLLNDNFQRLTLSNIVLVGDITDGAVTEETVADGAITASKITVTDLSALGATIGGWEIGSSTITDAAGTVGLSSAVTGGDDIRFWAGHATPGSAPFRVTEAGVVIASSGTIGGFTLGATTITGGSLTLDSTGIIRAGKTQFDNTETGFILGYDSATPKFYIGNTTDYLSWDGTKLAFTSATDNQINIMNGGTIRVNDGGDILLRSDETSPAEIRWYNFADADEYITAYQESAETTALVDYYAESNQDDYLILCNQTEAWVSTKIGQTFHNTSAAKITSAKFYLRKFGSPTGNATAKLYAITGSSGTTGKPTGSALATSDNFDVSTLTTSFGLATFTFTGAQQYTMGANTDYCIVIDYAGGTVDTHEVWVGIDTSLPAHSGNGFWEDIALGWTAFGNTLDVCFYVYNDQGGATATGIIFDASDSANTPYVKFDSAITVQTDTIGETTSAHGVTIDGLNIKDAALNTAASVPFAALAAGGMKYLGSAYRAVASPATVTGAQNTWYVLKAVGGASDFSLSITKSANTAVLLFFSATMFSAGRNQNVYLTPSYDGTKDQTAQLQVTYLQNQVTAAAGMHYKTGLAAGAHTITLETVQTVAGTSAITYDNCALHAFEVAV